MGLNKMVLVLHVHVPDMVNYKCLCLVYMGLETVFVTREVLDLGK